MTNESRLFVEGCVKSDCVGVCLESSVSISRLRRAIESVALTEPILRAACQVKENKPILIIQEQAYLNFEFVDVRIKTDQTPAPNADIDALLCDHGQLFMNPEEDLLCHRLIKLEDRRYLYLCCFYPGLLEKDRAVDLIQRVCRTYESDGQPQASFDVFMLANRMEQHDKLQRDSNLCASLKKVCLDYWNAHLCNLPLAQMPTDWPRSEVQDKRSVADFNFEISQCLADALNAFCESHKITLFIVLSGAWQFLLSRDCQQNDICIETEIDSDDDDTVDTVSYRALVRTDLSCNPNVIKFLQKVKETVAFALVHQPVSLHELNVPEIPYAIFWQKKNTDITEFSEKEITLFLQEDKAKIRGTLEYNSALFSDKTIERIARSYRNILECFIEHPLQALQGISFFKPGELKAELGLSDEVEIYPLTTSQRDIYLAELAGDSSGQACLGYWLDIHEVLNLEAWQLALQHYVNENSALRIQIQPCHKPYADLAYQVIRKKQDAILECEEWSEDLCEALVNKTRRLGEDPLIQYYLIHISSGHWRAGLVAHAIVLDSASCALHISGIESCYERIVMGKRPMILTDTYPDYVRFNNRMFDTEEVRLFWEQAFANVRPLTFSANGVDALVNHDMEMSASQWQAIKKFSRTQKVAPVVVLKAVYSLLIAQYCDAQADFLVMEYAGGREKQFAQTLGRLCRTVPFVVEIAHIQEKTARISALFQFIKNYQKTAITKPISDFLCAQLMPAHSLKFEFCFVNFTPQITLLEEKAQYHFFETADPLNTVKLEIRSLEDRVKLKLSYKSSRFLALNFLERFSELCDQLVRGVELIADLDFLLEKERKQMALWSQGGRRISNWPAMHQLVEKQVANKPRATALRIVSDGAPRTLTYQQIENVANQLADQLMSLGCEKGEFIMIYLARQDYIPSAILGVLKAGAAYIPVNEASSPARLEAIAVHGHVRFVLTERKLQDRLQSISRRVEAIEIDFFKFDQQAPAVYREVAREDLVYRLYSSPSESEFKSVCVTHQAQANLVHWYCRELDLKPGQRLLSVLSFESVGAQKNIFAALMMGAELMMGAPLKITELQDMQADILNIPFSVFNALSAPLGLKVLVLEDGFAASTSALKAWSCKILSTYGAPECTDVAAYHWYDATSDQMLLGRPIDNMQIFVVDSLSRLKPPGLSGQMVVLGQGVNHGSVHIPETGWLYHTADLACYTPEGQLKWVGKVREKLIELEAVEEGGAAGKKRRKENAVQDPVPYDPIDLEFEALEEGL